MEQVTWVSMEDLTQAPCHPEGYVSSMITTTVELESLIGSYHDCTDIKDIYKALTTSTNVNPQHIYPQSLHRSGGSASF